MAKPRIILGLNHQDSLAFFADFMIRAESQGNYIFAIHVSFNIDGLTSRGVYGIRCLLSLFSIKLVGQRTIVNVFARNIGVYADIFGTLEGHCVRTFPVFELVRRFSIDSRSSKYDFLPGQRPFT